MELQNIALIYLAVINVVTFFMYGIDKWKAKKSKWSKETIYSEEFQEDIDPIAHEKQYLGELKDIKKKQGNI